jgi:EamA domain-containing membrane protein RarD
MRDDPIDRAVNMMRDASRQYRRAQVWFAVSAVLMLLNLLLFAYALMHGR